MRLIVLFLILIAAGALAVGAFVYIDAGYVMLSWENYTVETSLWMFLVLGAIALLAVYIALRALLVLFGSDRRFNEWRQRRRSLRARRQTTRGLLALAQGQWRRAERNLTSSAKDSDQPLINYLAAARAAYEQDKSEATDEWLKQASLSTKGSDLAVGITQVQLLQSRHQNEQALAVLISLREKHPRHAYLLKLLVKTLQDLEDWVALNELLPTLRKATKIPDEELRKLERNVALQLLDRARHANGGQGLTATFDGLGRDVRYTSDVMKSYVDLLLETEQEEKAEEALREGLKHVWHDELVEIYGRLKGKDANKQLLFAEQQLKERPNDPLLLLTLGRLALRVNDLEKAREYLQTGLSIRGLAELHAEMGKVMLAEGDETLACEHFQLALGH
ncbi:MULTISPECIES: heme biosynthesis protein HemY [Thalassolituus]|uniref:heme biosynthesis protein HemY n=1 Tax=Thalassolituus TaxID=187492 RepID=UPI000C436E26|nr:MULTISPECIES: heme biosynthesis HemY N-terminal domain-containing protein [Thalassolituus]MAX85723.1 heme biosynthesis protein HemY [Oceanospirillaceae bacterium]MEC8907590.1 heme biosynthesis HemY N-terminal domain-containing protein [Pseudomonadota bacterium]HCG78098.1 heme biosynthesis protein HemY [Oceanospirillales bacterium]MED5441396.1 heme biosynthesis HemY N-terminal domain-containing protein [Pseudomonadota bacterium]MEE3161365.1 heme biosynthesis HemY N-terminal domain-containing|tara:strand:+ start:121 stop:1296 length:1176 start_codon:yes stop_codon:yes gene_type:complete